MSRESPATKTYVKALYMAELRQEAKAAGMKLKEYIKMVEEETNGIQPGSF